MHRQARWLAACGCALPCACRSLLGRATQVGSSAHQSSRSWMHRDSCLAIDSGRLKQLNSSIGQYQFAPVRMMLLVGTTVMNATDPIY